MPWPAGNSPVSMVLCAGQVTAGSIARNGRMPDCVARRLRCGSRRGEQPRREAGTLTRITRRMMTWFTAREDYRSYVAGLFVDIESLAR